MSQDVEQPNVGMDSQALVNERLAADATMLIDAQQNDELAKDMAAAADRKAAGAELLREALGYLTQVESYVASGQMKLAASTLNALKGIRVPPDSPVKGTIDQLIQSARVDESYIDSEVLEEEPTALATSNTAARYSSVSRMSKKIQDYFNSEFSASSFKTATVETDAQGNIIGVKAGETVDGEKVREDFALVAAAGMTPEEKKAAGDKPLTPPLETEKDTAKVEESLERLKKVKLGKVLEGPGSDEEKRERAEEITRKFEKTKEKLAELKDAQQREGKAPAGFGAAMKDNTRQKRDEAEKSIRKDVIEGALVDEDAQFKQRQAAKEQDNERSWDRKPPEAKERSGPPPMTQRDGPPPMAPRSGGGMGGR